MRFDGIQFFKDFHIRYSSSGSNVSQGWVGTSCPFCNDKSDHLGLHIQTGAMSCWKCGRHSALDYIKLSLRVPLSEAKSLYSRYLSKSIYGGITRDKSQVIASSVSLPDDVYTSTEMNYLIKRNITREQMLQYDLRGGGLIGEWAYRIVIPIYYNNVIVSASGRSISKDAVPKYYNLPIARSIMNMKHIFMGMDLIPEAGNMVAVVEGQIDAIRGGPGFIASFGVNLTDEQLLLLKEYDTIYFVRDSDDAGEHYVKEAYKLSALGAKNVEVISLQGVKDVGEMSDNEVNSLRRDLGFVE